MAMTSPAHQAPQCQRCGNIFMADSMFCRHCGAKREEFQLRPAEAASPKSPAALSEQAQGQILVERKVEAFRQLAANLDAQVIDQIVEEHNRRLGGGASASGLEACRLELLQCQETLALREQELSDCREELQRLREHCASLEDREQKLAAVVGAGPTQARAQPVYAPMAAATGSVRFDKMDANHDGIISKEEFESHCGNCGNLYMADTVFCRICGRRRQLAAQAPSSAPSAASAGSPVRGSCMVHGLQAAMAAPVSYVPMQQNVMFNRIDANHDGVLSTEELVSHCPGCGNVYMADSIFCRNCGRRRD
ncbi:unnamed protein product [Effrenium voratum]|nr:unnamed protein product [Effrenium voratum]